MIVVSYRRLEIHVTCHIGPLCENMTSSSSATQKFGEVWPCRPYVVFELGPRERTDCKQTDIGLLITTGLLHSEVISDYIGHSKI